MVNCCVPFCSSKSGKSKGISFHDFPTDSHLRQQWLKVISRDNFTPNTNSYTQAVCSLHFQASDYKPGLKNRCLKPLSVPSVFPNYPSYKTPQTKSQRKISIRRSSAVAQASKVQPSALLNISAGIENECLDNVPLPPSSAQNSLGISADIENECLNNVLLPQNSLTESYSQTTWNIDEEILSLKRQNLCLRSKVYRVNKKLSELQSRLNDAHEKLNKYENSTEYIAVQKVVKAVEEDNDSAIILLEQLLNFNKKVSSWNVRSLTKCVGLRFCSPKAYNFVRRNKMFKLPAKSTLARFIGNVSCETGISSLIKQRLRSEIANLHDSEKYASLIIDEMAVKSQLIYDKKLDTFLGQEDVSLHLAKINNSTVATTETEDIHIANNMLCFIIQGLSTNYRLPVAYFFSKQLSGRELHSLTLHVLKEVEKIGFSIIRIVTDNHKINVCMMRLLSGGKLSHVISHPLDDERKLFLSFDPSHLIKNIRNFFLEKEMPDVNGEISGNYIKKLYYLQKKEVVKLVHFLTRKHIEPTNFEKMNVKRAVQIFWPQVIAAIKFLQLNPYTHPDAFSFSKAHSTIKFMEYMQKWFFLHDISNRNKYMKLKDINRQHFFDLDDERLDWLEHTFLQYIQNLHTLSQNANKVFLSAETYEAICMTTKSTTECIKYLLESGFHFVLTRNFSSDAIELFFSSIRQLSGANDMLDTRCVVFSMNYIIKTGLLALPSSSNVECSSPINSPQKILQDSSENNNPKNLSYAECVSMIPANANEILNQIGSIKGTQRVTMKLAGLAFIAGFLIRKLSTDLQGQCSSCIQQLLQPKQSSPFTNLIQNQDRGSLIYPNKKFVEALSIIQDFVIAAAPSLIGTKNASFALSTILEKVLSETIIFECPEDSSHFPIVWELISKSFVPLLLKNFACTLTENKCKRKAMYIKPASRKILKLS